MIDDNLRYQISEGVLARSVGDTLVLFHSDTERLLTLHDTGPRILELLPECASTGEIVRRLEEEYDGPPALIREQVVTFLADLEAEQIVRRIE